MASHNILRLCAHLLMGASCLLISVKYVEAQSSPGWTYGYTPSYQEWNERWAGKQDTLTVGSINANWLAYGASATNLSPFIPNLSSNVEGTGIAGIDQSHWMIYQAPYTVGDAVNASLRVQRSASYPKSANGSGQGTVKTIWGLDYTSPTGSYFEWAITGELHNQSDAVTSIPSGGIAPQNVAVNGTAFKQFSAGYSYGSDQISPTWGGNFVCNDQTAVVNPTNGCVGAEIDNYYVGGVGADTNNQRVVLQLAWGGQGTPLATDHVGYGILLGGSTGIMDDAMFFGGAGVYGIGLNFASATFSNAPLFLGAGQKIVFDGIANGTYNWALSDISGSMTLQYQGANRMTIDNTGVIGTPNGFSTAGTGTAGSWTSTVYAKSPAWLTTGTPPTPTGTCSVNNQVGGNTAGTFKLNGACSSGTVILTFASGSANNDWICFATDATTPATTISQNNTTASTTAATLKFNASGSSGDLIRFSCTGV